MRVVLLLAAIAVVASCTETAPTYSDDVAPLLARRCTRCHAGGASGIEPPLLTAEQATRAAEAIARAAERREMPPWGADNTGHCGTFRHASWLSSAEVTTLTRWARAGAPLGTGARTAAPAAPPPASSRAPGTWTIDAGARFSPGLGAAASRCFLVRPPERDLVAASISGPAELAVVQTLFALEHDAAVAPLRRLESEDDAPGFSCPLNGPIGARVLLSWSYVTPVVELPAAAGVAIPAGRPLVLQVRADLAALGLSAVVVPRLTLGIGDGPAAELVELGAAPSSRRPRKRAEVTASWHASRSSRLVGVVPRLGSRARTLEVAVERASSRTCAAYFGHWRPALEQLYLRDTPLELNAGDRVRASCTMSTFAPASADDGASACGVALLVTSASAPY